MGLVVMDLVISLGWQVSILVTEIEAPQSARRVLAIIFTGIFTGLYGLHGPQELHLR
jgi:hypothetical protein